MPQLEGHLIPLYWGRISPMLTTLVVVCHTYREETETSARIRLISARKATKNEAKQYERR